MNTSESGGLTATPTTSGNWETALKGMEGVPPGLPDPAVLARMANEFFTALGPVEQISGSLEDAAPQIVAAPLVPASTPIPAAPVPAIPGGAGAVPAAAAPNYSFLQQTRLLFPDPETLPATPNPFAQPLGEFTPPELAGAALPSEVPQTPTPSAPDSPATFSFLEEARPFFAEPEAGQAASNPFTQPLGNFILQELAGAALPTLAPEALLPPMPTLPGAFGKLDSSAVPTFSFLEEARPLFSYPPTTPGPAPAQFEPVVPNLSSYPFDAETIKRDFPILRERVNGRSLVWLDNAATTQKPQSVIDRLSYFYTHENSNVHRAAHELAARATDAYESAREKVRRFLNASAPREIIFVRGTTEGINLVAQSWGRHNIHKDDEIVITWLEHHANIVPWQMLAAEKGARLRVAPVDNSGQVILEEYEKLLNPKTRLVSVAQVSNALGTVTPVKEMIEAAHRYGARVLVDGAQAVSHMRADVQALDCDFYVLSGHKMFAPTGIGVVYGKSEILDVTPPWQGGGSMIQDVTFEKTVYSPPPARFEAGTGNIADAVGLGAAIDYLDRVGMANITRYESELLIYGTEALQRVPGLHIIGTAKEKAGVLSFILDGVRTEDIGDLLNREGIAVRAGHHCAQPIHRRFGLEATVRASLALYNTCEDIDALVAALLRIQAGRVHRV